MMPAYKDNRNQRTGKRALTRRDMLRLMGSAISALPITTACEGAPC
jgi:hypothetical protein